MTEAELLALCRERGGTIGPSVAETMVGTVKDSLTVLPPEISEKDFMAKVVEYAESRGFLVYHPWLSIRSNGGYLDLTCVSPERKRVVWVEIKTETGKQTAAQRKWFLALEKAGAEVYLWRPSDWDTILKILA